MKWILLKPVVIPNSTISLFENVNAIETGMDTIKYSKQMTEEACELMVKNYFAAIVQNENNLEMVRNNCEMVSKTTHFNRLKYDLGMISETEFKAACDYYEKISVENPESELRNFFAKDMNADLGGYGGSCEICGTSNESINCFTVKTFNAGLMTENGERNFSISLYMCRNCASVSDGWVICDASIGGMTPFDWLKEIRNAEAIPSEFLFCRLKYRAQLTYDINNSDANNSGKVIDAEPKTVDIKLTPLMAAKWFVDNKDHIDE